MRPTASLKTMLSHIYGNGRGPRRYSRESVFLGFWRSSGVNFWACDFWLQPWQRPSQLQMRDGQTQISTKNAENPPIPKNSPKLQDKYPPDAKYATLGARNRLSPGHVNSKPYGAIQKATLLHCQGPGLAFLISVSRVAIVFAWVFAIQTRRWSPPSPDVGGGGRIVILKQP